MKYRNTETGIVFTEEEIRELYDLMRWESEHISSFENFSDYLGDLVRNGSLEEVED